MVLAMDDEAAEVETDIAEEIVLALREYADSLEAGREIAYTTIIKLPCNFS